MRSSLAPRGARLERIEVRVWLGGELAIYEIDRPLVHAFEGPGRDSRGDQHVKFDVEGRVQVHTARYQGVAPVRRG